MAQARATLPPLQKQLAQQRDLIAVLLGHLPSDQPAAKFTLASLRAKERRQLRTIARLSDPRGAIPEIHDKLRLVGPHEELIFLEGLPSPTPEPESGL